MDESSEITTVWRPRQSVRVVAIGIPFRDGRLLASAVTEDDGRVKGWRPLGGGVEFGENAEAAVLREFREELDAVAQIERRIGILENLFDHHGTLGHEIVFAFELRLTDPGQAREEAFVMEDAGYRNHTRWVPLAEFSSGAERLLPDGLLPLLEGLVPPASAP